MSKVLLGQSYFMRFDPKEWDSMKPFPPLGTLYAASYLGERGHEVALFDAMLSPSEEEWSVALDAHRPDVAVIYEDSFNYLSKMCLTRMREAAFKMAAAAHQRGCTVLISSSDATDHFDDYFAHGADGIIIGEGEVTLAETLEALAAGQSGNLDEIPGLAWRGRAPGTARGFMRDLDSLPFPAWDLVDVERYRNLWVQRHGHYSINMVTTRGCPYHCNWCAKPIYGQRYNVRSPENVAAEMLWHKRTLSPDRIWFADDIFGLKPGWIERFADEVNRLDAVIPFKCLLRVDLIKPGIPEALKRAGCEIVWVGAESGSQRILDAMDKGTRVEQIHAASRMLHTAGIKIAFFLQFGYPGEEKSDIEATLRMVRECEPDDIGMSVSYPLPGTKFFETVRAQLGEKQNWLDSGDFEMMYEGPQSSDYYRKLHTVLHKEFRARKHWRELIGPTSSDWNIGRKLRALFSIASNWASLPLERMRLRELERQSRPGVGPLPRSMTAEAASSPSAQPE